MRLGDALDRLDQRVLTKYPWLSWQPKRRVLFQVVLVVAMGVAQSLTRLTLGGTWADVAEYLIKYLGAMAFLLPLILLIQRRRAERRASRDREPPA